jgi:hypothetical protein
MARVVHPFRGNYADASTMELPMEWAGQSSQDHRATVLLRQEYELLLDLFRRQREPALDPPIDRDALQGRIVALVELIDRIEREVFFPALPSQYGPLLRSFTAEQEDLERCLATLRRTTANPVRANATGERLEQLAREHLTHQETLLFPAVEREHPDLNCVLYDRLVAERPRFAHEEGARVA